MGGDSPVGGNQAGAVALEQSRAHVGMQLQVERLELFPQTIDLGRQGIGRHVVIGSPHRPHIGEAQVPGPGVGQGYEARVARPHVDRDTMPSLPGVEQGVGVAARGEDALQVGDLQTLPGGRAILAAAIVGLQSARETRQLGRLGGIGWRRGHERQAQQHELPGQGGWQPQPGEAARLHRQVSRRHVEALTRLGRQLLGIERDVGVGHPIRSRGLDAQIGERRLRPGHEPGGFRDRGRPPLAPGHDGEQQEGSRHGGHAHHGASRNDGVVKIGRRGPAYNVEG